MRERWRRWRVVLRRALRRIVYSRSSSQSIAAGVALGVFVGLTPTVGFQMLIAALAATVLRVNRLAAVFPVWLTNPATIVPIYYFEYQVGARVWPAEGGPHVLERLEALKASISAVTVSEFWSSMGAVFASVGQLGAEILVPLILGSLVVGTVCAAAAYPLTLWAVVRIRKQRERYAVRKAERRIETLKAAGLFADPEDDAPPEADVGADPHADARGDGARWPQIVSLPPRAADAPADAPDRTEDPPSRANGA
ncbi:MAG: DUF2062 domain-containing protein [Planctomycetota bacterium]